MPGCYEGWRKLAGGG